MTTPTDRREEIADYSQPKPADCPFCGVDILSNSFWFASDKANAFYHVFCLGCGSQGPINTELEEAVIAWNRRALPSPDGLVRALEIIASNTGVVASELARTALAAYRGEG